MAGPDLSAVAHPDRNVDRRYLLESMILPNARIAKGFGTVTLVLDTGKLVAGTIKDEDAASLTLVTPSNETMRIARNTIEEQSATTSAMPAMTRALTLREIRDLTEYLSLLTTRSEPK
jgi:quinoprotein glucose dehydrogenase